MTLEPTHHFKEQSLPLVGRPFEDKALLREYLHHVDAVNQEVFRWDVIGPLVARYQALIDAEVQRDKKKLYSYQMFIDNVTQDVNADGYVVPGLQPFVENRHAFLDGHASLDKPRVELANVTLTPELPTDQDIVQVTVRVAGTEVAGTVHLRWRVRGAFEEVQMFDDGANGDGAADDGVYGASIPAQAAASRVEYFFIGKAKSGKFLTFLPAHGERAAFSYTVQGGIADLRINEFLASNQSGAQDEMGEFEDWAEIINISPAPLDLGGLWLSDNPANRTKWQIPAPTVLNAGERLLVWCDDEPTEGPYHATFKLSSNGESVLLSDADGGVVLDQLDFGPQTTDHSSGRLLDGTGPWVTLEEPTAGTANQPDCGVRHYNGLDATQNGVGLHFNGTPQQGERVTFEVRDGPAAGLAFVYVSLAPEVVETPFGVQLVDVVGAARFRVPLDGQGDADLTVDLPNDGSLPGIDLYFQALCFGFDGNGALVGDLSNALELDVCQ